MTICFFENEGGRLFAPLTLTRPVDELRIGVFTIHEKWQRYLNAGTMARIGRVPLTFLYNKPLPDNGEDVIWINSRWLPDPEAVRAVSSLKAKQLLRRNGTVLAVRLGPDDSRQCFENGISTFLGTEKKEGRAPSKPESSWDSEVARSKWEIRQSEIGLEVIHNGAGTLLSYLWDLFLFNDDEIRKDVALLRSVEPRPAPEFSGVIISHPEEVYAEEDVRVDPGTIIDASGGPVYLGRDVHIMAGCMIQGPAALCHHSVVRMGTKIYSGTTIGPVCKVAGEIQNVIMHSHSNKAHDGYLGNSLIGEWCNLGAHTTTSNLRNNYKPIKIPEWATGRIHRTPIQFFGTVMGDHGKTAINTTLSAGTLCGVFCNIFTYGFPPKHVPSFSWVSPHHTEPYQFEKAMETAEIMMARRGIPLKKDYLMMMRHIFDHREVMG